MAHDADPETAAVAEREQAVVLEQRERRYRCALLADLAPRMRFLIVDADLLPRPDFVRNLRRL